MDSCSSQRNKTKTKRSAQKFRLQLGKGMVLRLSGVRSKFQKKKPQLPKSGQEGYTSGARRSPGTEETEARWCESEISRRIQSLRGQNRKGTK